MLCLFKGAMVLQCGLVTYPSEALSCLLIPRDPNPFLGNYPIWSWLLPTLLLGYPWSASRPELSRFFFLLGSISVWGLGLLKGLMAWVTGAGAVLSGHGSAIISGVPLQISMH